MSKPTAETSAGSIKDIKKIIEDEITETLNLASVDPNEIVVFQDKEGKLKSSNVSINDILIRQSDATENLIALYSSDGRLIPGALVSTITDAIATRFNELKDHIKDYNTFRKNIIYKFFGTPLEVIKPSVVPPPVVVGMTC